MRRIVWDVRRRDGLTFGNHELVGRCAFWISYSFGSVSKTGRSDGAPA